MEKGSRMTSRTIVSRTLATTDACGHTDTTARFFRALSGPDPAETAGVHSRGGADLG
jgi:hypothetical protein